MVPWSEDDFKQWAAAPRYGRLTQGASFVSLKVPLDESLHHACIDEGDTHTTAMFIDRMQSKGLSVGMVIDAMFDQSGTKYHAETEWTDWDIDVVRLEAHAPEATDQASGVGASAVPLQVPPWVLLQVPP